MDVSHNRAYLSIPLIRRVSLNICPHTYEFRLYVQYIQNNGRSFGLCKLGLR